MRKQVSRVSQQQFAPSWDDFKYIRRVKGTIDGRKDAERIKRVLASPDDAHRFCGEIRAGVEMMQLCAGSTPSPGVPYDIQFLAAHQYVQDYHAGLKLLTFDAVVRCSAICRAAIIVGHALDELEKARAA